jgi:Uri superfamily endonuclease
VVTQDSLDQIPREPGVYTMVFALAQDGTLAVGRRTAAFCAGYYLYVGSALGGLRGRLRRHLIGPRRKHWHVDALLDAAPVIELWYALEQGRTECGRSGSVCMECIRMECAWATRLQQAPGLEPSAVAFGASDCRCHTHLFYSPARPSIETLGWPGARSIQCAAEDRD